MSRIALPPRRYAEAFDLEYEGHKFRVQLGPLGADGNPGELFVNAHKVDSALDSLAGDIAILISLLLQHGATAATIGHALRRNPNNSRASLAGVLVDRVAAHVFTPAGGFTEETCPGHVASRRDPKVCGRCGIHIDSLRPEEAAE